MSGLKSNRSYRKALYAVALIGLGMLAGAGPAAAQQQIGFQPRVGPICSGPLGPGPCADVHRWMGQNFPGAGVLPRDGLIVAEIARSCGGEPSCMATAWGSVEIGRCRNGFGVEGGCFGPNGEIMRLINRVVPQHLQPNVIMNNIQNDIQNGPGDNNDVVGKNGWLRKRLGF